MCESCTVEEIIPNMRSSKAQTVQRALDVLQVFIAHEGEVSLSDISKSSGLNVSTVYRIISVLRKNGYVIPGDSRGKYLIGAKFLEFSSIVKSTLKIEDLARPFMQNLQKLSNESVHISRVQGYQMSYLEIIHSTQVLRIIPVIGVDAPLHCTAAGKVFLAQLSDKKFKKLFKSGKSLESYTSNTITDINELKKQLERVRKDGVAIDREECVLGVTDIAAPIMDSDGKLLACLGTFVPSPRATDEKIASLIPMIRNCALEISRALGYRI
jgi:IclR family KDG regulon transcriptional repressor